MKVGRDTDGDVRRAALLREEISADAKLMMDANQIWDVGEAIARMGQLREFDPWWIEEPTSPDDVLGHAALARAIVRRPRLG
jgi:L-fuconate dehydratase